MGSVVDDDGSFFISVEDYWEEYCMTSICQEQNDKKYFHSQAMHNFADSDDNAN